MGGANTHRINIDGSDWMRDMEKRVMSEERRPQIRGASDLLGPGFGPHAIQTMDWNSAETGFNGIFYSVAGQTVNSPDNSTYWIGHVLAQQDGYGVQHLYEHRVAGDPALLPIRQYVRRFYNPGTGGLLVYGPWTQAGLSGVTRRLAGDKRTTTLAAATPMTILTANITAVAGRTYRAVATVPCHNNTAGAFTHMYLRQAGAVFAGFTFDHRIAARQIAGTVTGEFTSISNGTMAISVTLEPGSGTATCSAAGLFPATMYVDEIVP